MKPTAVTILLTVWVSIYCTHLCQSADVDPEGPDDISAPNDTALPVLLGESEDCSGPNETYQECGTACPESCDFVPEACIQVCRSGCFCIPGFVRDADGICIDRNDCPALNETVIVDPVITYCGAPNEEYSDCGTACPERCDYAPKVCIEVCRRGCFCKPGFVRGAAGICIDREDCPLKQYSFYYLYPIRDIFWRWFGYQ